MKNGWLNLDLLEFLSALPFLVFLFIKCEEIPCSFFFFLNRFRTFHWRDGSLQGKKPKTTKNINVVGKEEKLTWEPDSLRHLALCW